MTEKRIVEDDLTDPTKQHPDPATLPAQNTGTDETEDVDGDPNADSGDPDDDDGT